MAGHYDNEEHFFLDVARVNGVQKQIGVSKIINELYIISHSVVMLESIRSGSWPVVNP